LIKFDSYIICTSPRSGSTLLCKLLAATGVAGNPASYFHEPSVASWASELGIVPEPWWGERETLAGVFRAAIAEGNGGTDVSGIRLQRHSFNFFHEKLALLYPGEHADLARLRRAFGSTLFIHLRRRDKVEQAVSYLKAHQTGLWHVALDGSELERLAPPGEPVYDADELRKHVETMTGYDRDWNAWFQREGIEPMCVDYDALAAAPVRTVKEILGRLGRDRAAADGIVPGVRKLADSESRDWVARYRSEC